MTTREEAAAKASYAFMENSTPEMFDADTELTRTAYLDDAKVMIAAADAHDAAHGIHRVSLDDATVERAARRIFPSYWDDDAAECFETPEALAECQKGCTDHVRAVLAAAVEADHE